MLNKRDIEELKRELERSIGKTIVLRYNYNRVKGVNKGSCCTYIIENVYSNYLVLRKVINENIGLIESYTFVDILSGFVDIIDIR